MKLEDLTKEMIDERAFIDMAYIYLEELGEETDLYSIVDKFQDMGGYTEKEIENRILQFYTDLNTDGRFVSTDDGVWGLRKWYTVDDINDKIAPTVHKFDIVDEEEEVIEEDELGVNEIEKDVDNEEEIEGVEEEEDIDRVIDEEQIDTKDINFDEGETIEDNYDDGDDY